MLFAILSMLSDVLSDVLRSLRVSGTVYFCEQLDPPWEKRYSGDDVASFHQIRRGSCILRSGDLTEHLGPGDLVFLAPGRAHNLGQAEPVTTSSAPAASTLLMCGYCQFDSASQVPLAEIFPDLIVIRYEQLQSLGSLKAILDYLSHEYLSMQPGTELVVNRLTEVLIVELVRMNFGRNDRTPLIQALADKHVGKALQLIHQSPAKHWSLAALASEVGQSRATFAKRFKTLTGHPMFDYLTQLRMQLGCQLLSETNLPLHVVANRVGYESDLAFTRAFKKRLGLTPTAYRNQQVVKQ